MPTTPCARCTCLAVRVPQLVRRLWLVLRQLWCVLLLVTASHAEFPYPHSVAVELRNGDAGGSAAAVGVANGRCLYFSCGHIFENNARSPEIRWPNSTRWQRARVLAVDAANDLSAIDSDAAGITETAHAVRCVRDSDGDLVASGYPFYAPRDKGPNYTTGKFLRLADSSLYFAAKPCVHSGFSGAGVFAPDGSLVGIVSAYNDSRESIAVSGPALVRFAAKWLRQEREP